MTPGERESADRLAAESLRVDDATGWFDRLYAAAERGEAVVPWDDGEPHPLLVEWAEAKTLDGEGRRAIVVGCGLGDDSEHVAGLGFETVAFDVAPTAIEAARRRFPDSRVEYLTADLLRPPAEWHEGFDLVVEILTVQSLPDPPRGGAIAQVSRMVAPGGTLIVIATARRDETAPWEGPPWPLTHAEVESFAIDDLQPVQIERVDGATESDPARWRAEFRGAERA
jgi:SAM-dependent methyltransferase